MHTEAAPCELSMLKEREREREQEITCYREGKIVGRQELKGRVSPTSIIYQLHNLGEDT